MALVTDTYYVTCRGRTVGYYRTFSDHTVSYEPAPGSPWERGEELKALGLDKRIAGRKSIRLFAKLIDEGNRVPGRKRILYRDGPLGLERVPRETEERFSVYRRSAKRSDADYSPLPHDAPHQESAGTPEDMREWASWYAFVRMDDGTYQAELDEAWCWGGGHNDGGTIRRGIPEAWFELPYEEFLGKVVTLSAAVQWFELPYEEFLGKVVTLSAAVHYGFTPELLMRKSGLREFFGYGEGAPAAMRSPGAERNERAMTEKCGGPQERIERVPDARIPGSNVLFDGGEVVLAEAEERLYLCDGPSVYGIGSSGYEPCTYLLRGGAVCTVIHNAFSESEIRRLAGHGGTVLSVTGTEYDIGRLCRLLAFAARFADCDIGYAEGKLAVEKLKELGAVSPERAVPPGAVGLRSVPSALSHSKRLKERVMTLEDGRIYVRIRG